MKQKDGRTAARETKKPIELAAPKFYKKRKLMNRMKNQIYYIRKKREGKKKSKKRIEQEVMFQAGETT